MIDPTPNVSATSDNTSLRYLAVISVLATRLSTAFAINDAFRGVISCWALWYIFGTLYALRNSWLRLEDGFNPKKSTDGIFLLLGWWSVFHVTATLRHIGGDGGRLGSDFIELACLAVQGAWLFKIGSKFVKRAKPKANTKWLDATANTIEGAADGLANKAQDLIKSQLGVPSLKEPNQQSEDANDE